MKSKANFQEKKKKYFQMLSADFFTQHAKCLGPPLNLEINYIFKLFLCILNSKFSHLPTWRNDQKLFDSGQIDR